MKTKIGLIPENNEVDTEMINYEREKRLIGSITKTVNKIIKQLNEEEDQWKNYELEETQVKIELSEMVLEQLLNELVEIFEHVHLSRKHPKLYQYKSIYGCEDIPRLSFQYGNMNDGDDINQ